MTLRSWILSYFENDHIAGIERPRYWRSTSQIFSTFNNTIKLIEQRNILKIVNSIKFKLIEQCNRTNRTADVRK